MYDLKIEIFFFILEVNSFDLRPYKDTYHLMNLVA